MQTITETLPERVASAATWLDEQLPGWAGKIDLDNFDMECHTTCLGKYLEVDWYVDLYVRYANETGARAGDLFSAPEVTPLWTEQILQRRNAV